jgi:1-acyl-sn-glycerol-3-phosphate acyltransferase
MIQNDTMHFVIMSANTLLVTASITLLIKHLANDLTYTRVGLAVYELVFCLVAGLFIGVMIHRKFDLMRLEWSMVSLFFLAFILSYFIHYHAVKIEKLRLNIKSYYLHSYQAVLTNTTRLRGILAVVMSLSGVWMTFYHGNTPGDACMVYALCGTVIGYVLLRSFGRFFIHPGFIGLSVIISAMAWWLLLVAPGIGLGLFGLAFMMAVSTVNATEVQITDRKRLRAVLTGVWSFTATIVSVMTVSITLSAVDETWIDSITVLYALFTMLLFAVIIKKEIVMVTWLLLQMLISIRYRIDYKGVEYTRHEGALLLLGNHISWIDWLIVQFPVERRVHYLMEREIYQWRLINPVMRLGKVIPISARASKEGFAQARRHIVAKEVVGMFPEGAISHTGELGKFYRGFELIGRGLHGKIVPLYIDGLYGSLFSRSKVHHVPKSSVFRRVITIRYGEPLPLDSTVEEIRHAIEHLKENNGA